MKKKNKTNTIQEDPDPKNHISTQEEGEQARSNTNNVPESVKDMVSEGGPVNEPEDPIFALENEITSLKMELEQSKDTLLRRTAEFENAKKRMMRENIRLLEDAKIEALKKFLPINDDLQRTLQASKDQEIQKAFLDGVTMVAEKFSSLLTQSGVEQINELNVPFDVNLHDAMLRMPAPDDSIDSNTVLQILEAGYKVGDKVIRHAKVIVSE
jgi:molecular chaperone GrpE